jgi:hypothetical protein
MSQDIDTSGRQVVMARYNDRRARGRKRRPDATASRCRAGRFECTPNAGKLLTDALISAAERDDRILRTVIMQAGFHSGRFVLLPGAPGDFKAVVM